MSQKLKLFFRRISKDHSSSSGPSVSASTTSSGHIGTSTFSTTDGAKLSKKGVYAVSAPQDVLPIVREEKKQKNRHKKMSTTAPVDLFTTGTPTASFPSSERRGPAPPLPTSLVILQWKVCTQRVMEAHHPNPWSLLSLLRNTILKEWFLILLKIANARNKR